MNYWRDKRWKHFVPTLCIFSPILDRRWDRSRQKSWDSWVRIQVYVLRVGWPKSGCHCGLKGRVTLLLVSHTQNEQKQTQPFGTGTEAVDGLVLKCLRPGWVRFWATWPNTRRPCQWQGDWNQIIFKIPVKPNHSMISWPSDRPENMQMRVEIRTLILLIIITI